jgi:flagellar motor protein MotB
MPEPADRDRPQQPRPAIMKLSWPTHAAFWACLWIAGLVGAWLLQRSLYFDGTPPVPLRVNPKLFSLSLAGVPVVLLALWASIQYTSRLNIAFALATLFIGLCLVGMVASLSPGPGSLVAREVVQVSSLKPKQNTFAYAVYFENGKPNFSGGESRRIMDALSVFRACEAGTLQVRGFASSAPYLRDPSKSDEYNKNLANTRAVVVKDRIRELSGAIATAKEWDSYEEMVKERRLRDVGLAGERLISIERLNRRVEIVWNDSRCTDGDTVAVSLTN